MHRLDSYELPLCPHLLSFETNQYILCQSCVHARRAGEAASAVFATIELLEAILEHMDAQNLVLDAYAAHGAT